MLTAILLLAVINAGLLAFLLWRQRAGNDNAAALWAYLADRDNTIQELQNRLLAKHGYKPLEHARSTLAAPGDETGSNEAGNDKNPLVARPVSILRQKRRAAEA